MPVTTTTLRDADHSVTYVNQAGATVTAQRDVILTVYAPATPGTYPVIVYSHGHGGSSSVNGGAGATAQALADLGYIVIMPNHLDSGANYPSWLTTQFGTSNPASGLHRAADMQFALDQVQTVLNGLPGYTADVSAPVVAGHSHGAFTAGLLAGMVSDRPGYDAPPPGNPYGLTSVADPRFAAAILLSPQGASSTWADLSDTSWDLITIPLLVITGTEDNEAGGGLGWERRLDPFSNARDDHVYALVYDNATHADIGGNATIPGITLSIAGFIDLFVDAHLRGDAAALARFGDPAGLLAADDLLTQAYVRSIDGTVGRGALRGGEGSDTLNGLVSDDLIYGLDGDDTLRGGLGNDSIDGGDGWDTALVRGARSDYRILITDDGFLIKGPDGLDRLTGVEVLRFDDGGMFDLARLYGGGWQSLDTDGRQILPGVADDPKDNADGREVLPGPVDDSSDSWAVQPGLEYRLAMLFLENGEQTPGGLPDSLAPLPPDQAGWTI